jgi:CO dehydrogenase maturation factor
MKPIIAMSGKGGTGKSTLAALIVQQLVASGVRPVLAVDADPNSCLAELLGVEEAGTVSELRDSIRNRDKAASGPSAVTQVDQGLNNILVEGDGFDLLTMGHPEGPGCYCYVNSLLKDWLSRAVKNYAACVVDNQAGMEHLSRLLAADLACLVMVAEPTSAAARAAGKIVELSSSLPMRVDRRVLVWNKVRAGDVPPQLRAAAHEEAVDEVIRLPWNERLAAACSRGERLIPGDVAALPDLVRALSLSRTTVGR